MDFYSFVIGNKEIFKLVYALAIVLICASIVVKSDRLFKLSSYSGIRYFRNAFFFFGIGFAIRYFLMPIFTNSSLNPYSFIVSLFFEFFLVMAGFFLLYSLMWKKIDSPSGPHSSLFNSKILIFYFFALIIVILDYFWLTLSFMFITQIAVFAIASIISFSNLVNKPGKNFPKFYFIAMVLALIAWILNAGAALYYDWNTSLVINVYILNALFFLLFLYGVIKASKS